MGFDSGDDRIPINTGETHTNTVLPDGGESETENGEEPDETQERNGEREEAEENEESQEDEEPEEDQDEGDEESEGEEGDERTHELIITVENRDYEYVQGATVTVEDKEGGTFEAGEQQDIGTDGEAFFLTDDGDECIEGSGEAILDLTYNRCYKTVRRFQQFSNATERE